MRYDIKDLKLLCPISMQGEKYTCNYASYWLEIVTTMIKKAYNKYVVIAHTWKRIISQIIIEITLAIVEETMQLVMSVPYTVCKN